MRRIRCGDRSSYGIPATSGAIWLIYGIGVLCPAARRATEEKRYVLAAILETLHGAAGPLLGGPGGSGTRSLRFGHVSVLIGGGHKPQATRDRLSKPGNEAISNLKLSGRGFKNLLPANRYQNCIIYVLIIYNLF